MELEAIFGRYEERFHCVPGQAAAELGAEIGSEVEAWRKRYLCLGEPVLNSIYDEVTDAVVRGDTIRTAQRE